MSVSYLFNPDTSFYDELFKDTDYWNTYQGILNQYSSGPANTFWGEFTGSNDIRDYEHNQQRSAALNALVEQMRTDQYNNTESQVQRDRAAGLNPDLLGASGGQPSDNASLPHSPTPPDESFHQVVSGAMSFISTVSSAVLSVRSAIGQSIINQGLKIQNEAQEIDNYTKLNNIAFDALLRQDTSNDHFLDEDGNIVGSPSISFEFNTGNKRLDKRLKNIAKTWQDSVPLELAKRKQLRDIAQTRKETFDVKSSAGYSDDDELYFGLAVRLSDLYSKLRESQITLEQTKVDNDQSYSDTFDPTLDAETTNAANSRKKTADEFYNEIQSLEEGMIGFLKTCARRGDQSAIDILFRIFGETINTSKFMNIGNEIGTSLQGSINGVK